MKAVFFVLFLVLATSCSFSDSDAMDVKDDFLENKPKFEKLVSEILKNKRKRTAEGLYSYKEELDKNISRELESLEAKINGIAEGDCDGYDVTFELLWDKSVHLFVCKEGCDSKRTAKGFVEKGQMIDVYGLGDGWVLWIDHDFI